MSDIRVSSVITEPGRTVVGRILPDTDLIPGIFKICQENELKYGYISMLIGSLKKVSYVYAFSEEDAKIGIKYSEPVIKEGPFEFLAGQGLIGFKEDRSRTIHLHGIISDEDMKLYGGHFTDTGNIVLVTIEVVIKEVKKAEIIKSLDQETEFPLFKFYK